MRNTYRMVAAIFVAASATLCACGGGSSTPGGASSDRTGGTLTVTADSGPDSLDPQSGDTSLSAEADIMVYEPLLTYAAKSGVAGTELIPDLATSLPVVSSNGTKYSLTLRHGLTYSDNTPVRVADVKFAIERALKLSWANSSYFTGNIVGAAAYASGKTKAISGIHADNGTGKITFQLMHPYGAFANILALPGSGPIPSNTPMKVLSSHPPIGTGPYKFGSVIPNGSYTLVRNRNFADFGIEGVPTGSVDEIKVSVNTNNSTNTEQVLQNQVDVLDPTTQIPGGMVSTVRRQASDRYKQVPVALQYYFFFNTRVAPFNNLNVRRAVSMATDRSAISRLSGGTITPGCWFLPPAVVGHQSGNCHGLDPTASPSPATVAKAKKLVADSGQKGADVTVWSEQTNPNNNYAVYYAGLLNKLGFHATLKSIANAVYFQTVGNRSLNAQTGFDDWNQDFPNPADFYVQLSKAGISARNSENYDNVVDPHIEDQLNTLLAVPASRLTTVAGQWQALDSYVDSKAYADVFGYGTLPQFVSTRVDVDSIVFSPIYHIEFSTVRLKR